MRPVFECDPKTEMSGKLATSLLTNLAENFKPLMAKHGLAQIDPDKWYPMQQVVDVFKEVSEQSGAMFDFVAIGMAAVERYVLPPELAHLTLEQFFLNVVPKLHLTQYRNGDASVIDVEKIGEKHLKLTVTSPYPDDTAYGFLYGLARRFSQKGASFTLKYDEHAQRHDAGGNDTILQLTWN